MGIVSISKRGAHEPKDTNVLKAETRHLIDIAAGGSLLAGGLLLLTRQRRAGLAMAMAGGVLTLLGQQETVREWWERFPGYVDQMQNLIGRVQSSVEELTLTRENLAEALTGSKKKAGS